MAASDVSALLDVASATSDPTPVETTEQPVGQPVAEPDTDLPEPQIEDDAPAEGADVSEPEVDKPVDGRTNPAAVRSALKAFRDLKPENAPIARELNDAYGRYTAYKGVFPKVADAQAAKAVLDAVGGGEGIASLQSTIKSVNETDSLLYAGDARVLDSILEDMKAAGKPEAFGKLAQPFLDKLRSTDEKAYFNAMKPHFFQGLVDVGLPQVLQNLGKMLNGATPNVEGIKALVGELTNWFDNLRNGVESGAKAGLDPERQAFEKERSEFKSSQQKEFQGTVASACDSHNNRALGTELKGYLKLPFFKNFSAEAKTDIGVAIKGRLYSELSADKGYQSQMDAFFSQPTPDKARIEAFHKAKVESMSRRIVKTVLETRYPGLGGPTPAKPGVPKPVAAQPVDPNKPSFVSSKPDWEAIDFDKDPNKLLYIAGKAILKNGRFVTWNPKYKGK